jgi:DNA-binding transcriptional ArsR family regulator
MSNELDQIWKALADETRRTILDYLRSGPKPTTAIVEQFPDLSRFAVMKHLDVLRQAALVVTREEGRQRINSLNAVPIRMIYERWVSNYQDVWANTLLRVKEASEGDAMSSTDRMRKNSKMKQKRRKSSRTPPVRSTSMRKVRDR